MTGEAWAKLRAKFRCEVGVTNVWREPPVRGAERLKARERLGARAHAAHANQKPLKLLERIVAASSDPHDVVWEPFGGLCSVAIAALRLGRRCYAAEIDRAFFETAARRLEAEAARASRSSGVAQAPGENAIG
ncbi:MAG TPA: DNA methyltransferase [Minicystis sp.]|nr:DNA methyltransferase [Minicystis sp.]